MSKYLVIISLTTCTDKIVYEVTAENKCKAIITATEEVMKAINEEFVAKVEVSRINSQLLKPQKITQSK